MWAFVYKNRKPLVLLIFLGPQKNAMDYPSSSAFTTGHEVTNLMTCHSVYIIIVGVF
jgi:hypothetical protein